jgi:hypothetical protein
MLASDVVARLKVMVALARFYGRLLPARWYRRFPFLPVPPRPYLAWRFQTAYGLARPRCRTIAHDIWQFGEWLAEGEGEDGR